MPHGTNEWGPGANRGSYVHIYAMSDIHGCLDAFKASLSTIDLDAEDSKLVLLGDYCDRGPDSLGVFELVMDLQKRYGDRVVALRGNHEEMFLEYIDEVNDLNFTQAWILADSNLATAKSFLDAEAFKHVRHLLRLRKFEEAYAYTVERMKPNMRTSSRGFASSLTFTRVPSARSLCMPALTRVPGSTRSSAHLTSRLL